MAFQLSSTIRAISLSSAIAVLINHAIPAAAAGPFADFAGTWTGTGRVTMNDGTQEAIRCKAIYAVKEGGQVLAVDVNCASDSYRVDIVSSVMAKDATLSGSWQERTRQIQGDVSGHIPFPDTFQASLQTLGGGIQLGARTDGKQQAITLTSQGSDIRGASITLRRS